MKYRLALGSAVALGFARFAYGLVVPAMRDQLGWSLADAGLQTTANGVGYLLGAIVVAMVIRRLGAARSFQLGMVVTTLALAATATTSSQLLQMFLRATAGLSGALVFVAGTVVAARLADRSALTVYFGGAGLGVALSGFVLPLLLDGNPDRWPTAWLLLAAGSLLATIISWSAVSSVPPTPDAKAKLGRLWPVGVAYVLFGAGYIVYITFLTAYLKTEHSNAYEVAATWTLIGAAAIAGPILWTRPLTTWRYARAMATLLALQAIAAVLPLLRHSRTTVLISAAIVGLTFLNVPASVAALVRRTVPQHEWTAVIGTLTVLFAAGQTVGPGPAGWLADHFGAAAALGWTAILCAAGALVALSWKAESRRTRGSSASPAPGRSGPADAAQEDARSSAESQYGPSRRPTGPLRSDPG
ncbi:putative MFS family arabinose efflux permease [Kribbella orskensis]|uniref:MFS family arabinose efflux permease n=1 Tax=Kribbella orskensis TaxID=2512216 RepID=A0ABY2BRJ2_9ACTN|nr:putative MFS family arabinose efflux permease [Kribbella sp. VKM Ac-2500]TCO29520.1 putative MFS family arabinose efflux permease [Kribbella orskensis]